MRKFKFGNLRTIKNHKAYKALFLLVMERIQEQAYSEETNLYKDEISFSFEELVNAGIFKDTATYEDLKPAIIALIEVALVLEDKKEDYYCYAVLFPLVSVSSEGTVSIKLEQDNRWQYIINNYKRFIK